LPGAEIYVEVLFIKEVEADDSVDQHAGYTEQGCQYPDRVHPGVSFNWIFLSGEQKHNKYNHCNDGLLVIYPFGNMADK
jgi:hypothetical protein